MTYEIDKEHRKEYELLLCSAQKQLLEEVGTIVQEQPKCKEDPIAYQQWELRWGAWVAKQTQWTALLAQLHQELLTRQNLSAQEWGQCVETARKRLESNGWIVKREKATHME